MRVDVDVGVGAKRVLIPYEMWEWALDGEVLALPDGTCNRKAIERLEELLDTAENLPKGCQIFRVAPSPARREIELLILHPSFARTEPFSEIPIFVPTFRSAPPT